MVRGVVKHAGLNVCCGLLLEGHATDELWTEALSWLDGFRDIKSQHYPDWVSLRKYPALLCLYAGGVAAISSSNYSTLEALLYRPEIAPKSYEVSRYPLILSTHLEILSPSLSKALQPGTIPGAVLPLRIRNWESMWVEVRSNFRSADEFDQAVLRFEYMFGLAHTDLALLRGDVSWCPRALLPYANHGTAAEFLIKKVDAEITQNGPNWSPLLAGMFGGSVDRLKAAKERFDPRASLWHQ